MRWGYSLVYGILKLLNFAHGDVFMVGSFIGFGALQLLSGSTDPVVGLASARPDPLAAMAGCAVLGVAISASPTGRSGTRPASRR